MGDSVELVAAAAHLVRLLVELEVGVGEHAAARRVLGLAGALEHCPDAGHHLAQAERLDDVVVAADRQPGHPIVDASFAVRNSTGNW